MMGKAQAAVKSAALRRVLAVAGPALLAWLGATPPVTAEPRHHGPLPHLRSDLPNAALVGTPGTRLARAYAGSKIDVTTFHYDNYRTGWNPSEADLTVANVGSANFGLLATLAVDGNVFAQPLLVSGFVMPDGTTRDVLIIATGHNSVYAFDAQNYARLWQVNLGPSQSTADVGCTDVQPEYGITSTPIIRRSGPGSATLYLITATEPQPGSFRSDLHALDLGTGADLQPQVKIAAAAPLAGGGSVHFDPAYQWSRAGLAYANDSLYVGIGSHGDRDAQNIAGWLLRYSPNLQLLKAFHTVRTQDSYELASIWMSGFAPAIDAAGNVFVATGNGARTKGAGNWGESVLRLPPDLSHVGSYFTPSDYADMNQRDADLGAGGVLLIPPVTGQAAPPMAVAMGKDTVLYLLNQNALGGFSYTDRGALQRLYFSRGGGVWGGPAFYNGPAGPTVFIQGSGYFLHALHVDLSAKPSLSAFADGTTIGGYGGSMPIVSSNGGAAGTGLVWVIRRTDPIQLEAYDATKLGAPIFAATAGNAWSNQDDINPFLTAMQANGRVYVPGYKTVEVFGLAK